MDENQELYYPAIMRAIAATDYDGYVGQELMPKGDPLAALEQAYKVCNAKEFLRFGCDTPLRSRRQVGRGLSGSEVGRDYSPNSLLI